jgi:hypothetical protein
MKRKMHMADGPEIQEFNPEWLVRRGNYLTFITPEIAADWLENRTETRNRKITRADVRRYAQAMQRGHWDIDASDIKMGRDGHLIDGQHRLMACLQAGVGFPTMLRTGVNKSTMRRVDIGKKRRVSDAFQIENVYEANNVAASINLRLRYEAAESRGLKLDASPSMRRDVVALSPDEALDYLRAHPEHEKTAPTAGQMHKVGPGISKSVWFAFMAMAANVDEGDAFKFADEVLGGDMRPDSPVHGAHALPGCAGRPAAHGQARARAQRVGQGAHGAHHRVERVAHGRAP